MRWVRAWLTPGLPGQDESKVGSIVTRGWGATTGALRTKGPRVVRDAPCKFRPEEGPSTDGLGQGRSGVLGRR